MDASHGEGVENERNGTVAKTGQVGENLRNEGQIMVKVINRGFFSTRGEIMRQARQHSGGFCSESGTVFVHDRREQLLLLKKQWVLVPQAASILPVHSFLSPNLDRRLITATG